MLKTLVTVWVFLVTISMYGCAGLLVGTVIPVLFGPTSTFLSGSSTPLTSKSTLAALSGSTAPVTSGSTRTILSGATLAPVVSRSTAGSTATAVSKSTATPVSGSLLKSTTVSTAVPLSSASTTPSIPVSTAPQVLTTSLVTLNGELVRIVDNCTLHSNAGCQTGFCCVREGLLFFPGSPGPKPAYQLACKPLRQKSQICIPGHSDEFCPCATSLTCRRRSGTLRYGRCV